MTPFGIVITCIVALLVVIWWAYEIYVTHQRAQLKVLVQLALDRQARVGPTAEQLALFNQMHVVTVLRPDSKYLVAITGPYELEHGTYVCNTVEQARMWENDAVTKLNEWMRMPAPPVGGVVRSVSIKE